MLIYVLPPYVQNALDSDIASLKFHFPYLIESYHCENTMKFARKIQRSGNKITGFNSVPQTVSAPVSNKV